LNPTYNLYYVCLPWRLYCFCVSFVLVETNAYYWQVVSQHLIRLTNTTNPCATLVAFSCVYFFFFWNCLCAPYCHDALKPELVCPVICLSLTSILFILLSLLYKSSSSPSWMLLILKLSHFVEYETGYKCKSIVLTQKTNPTMSIFCSTISCKGIKGNVALDFKGHAAVSLLSDNRVKSILTTCATKFLIYDIVSRWRI